jgi:hypothetical protein
MRCEFCSKINQKTDLKNDICQYPEIFYMYLKKNEFLFINFKTVYSLLKINLQKLKKTPDEISPVYIQMLAFSEENPATNI